MSGVAVCTLQELRERGQVLATVGERRVLVVEHEGRVWAIDNRCPHMGFPLHRGTLADGIITCHWHHARFELSGGCALDLFADDVRTYATEIVDGKVHVAPAPRPRDERAHALIKLEQGLEHRLSLVLAKASISLEETGARTAALQRAASFGIRNRADGWSSGLSILTCLANLMPHLDPSDRSRALFHGMVHVAARTAGSPPSFDIAPMVDPDDDPERLLGWFRRFAETRSQDAAERVLTTAIHRGLHIQAVAELVYAACTDHRYLDQGHTLDFATKAFELLDHLGWDAAGQVLPALVPPLVSATRMEETSSWRAPVDVAAAVEAAIPEFLAALDAGSDGVQQDWADHASTAAAVLDGEPDEALALLVTQAAAGAPMAELSAAVAYAAALRAAHFPTSNEHNDWDTVHHTFTFANAVDRAVRRHPSRLLARGILDAAASVHLERFLNVPKRPLPAGRLSDVTPAELLATFDAHGHVDEAGEITATLVRTGGAAEVIRTLGHGLLREDAGFHDYQILDAAVRQATNFDGRPEAGHILVGAARYLAAQYPTVRARRQTFDIARRLHRGEAIHDLEE
ncbi:MAG TPA: Rieske 2Fe-2S domain-containing protein [Nitriliruptorales bacterium]|nr:Rieske 2Fe-2S domain-containing protein [Nitriliruptorales bacterium]